MSFANEIFAMAKGEIEIIARSVVDCAHRLVEINTHPLFKGPRFPLTGNDSSFLHEGIDPTRVQRLIFAESGKKAHLFSKGTFHEETPGVDVIHRIRGSWAEFSAAGKIHYRIQSPFEALRINLHQTFIEHLPAPDIARPPATDRILCIQRIHVDHIILAERLHPGMHAVFSDCDRLFFLKPLVEGIYESVFILPEEARAGPNKE